ncbi:MAG TPA: hypothetical protein GXX20_12705 [Clostridiaceae bacterium]|nr:hypothetical protein [Clostridiaceae bacterium]
MKTKKIISLILAMVLLLSCMFTRIVFSADDNQLISSITVSANKVELQPGDIAQISYVLLDGTGQLFTGTTSATYTSINPSVATVDENGQILAVSYGITKIITTVQGPFNSISGTIAISVAPPSDRITFEEMTVGQPPTGMVSSNLALVTDVRGANSGKSVYLNDNSNTQLASLHYKPEDGKYQEYTLDFDVFSENGNVAFKFLSGNHANANTAYWIRFVSNATTYYSGSSYITISNKTLTRNDWNSVHIEVDNVAGKAAIYINGTYVGDALKTTGSYGSNTGAGIDGVYFLSSGSADQNDRFYIDNLKMKSGIHHLPVEIPQLSIELGGLFDIAKNTEPILDEETGEPIIEDYILEDYEDGFGFCHIPFTYAHPSYDKVYVNYSRHRDVVMDYPWDSVKVFDMEDILAAGDGEDLSESYLYMKTQKDLFLMSMIQLPDGRYFAQNYINYYIDNNTARTVSWIIDEEGNWEKVEGILTITGQNITGPLSNSNWFPFLFSKGVEIINENGVDTIIHTMYGQNKSLLVQSTDLGRTWTLRSIIAENDGTHYNIDGSLTKYLEPSLLRVKDGSLLSIIRTDSNKPLLQTRSYDNGLTWTKPILLPGVSPDDARSIYPQMVLLDNGVLALTTGRPNNTMLFSLDGSGYKWGFTTTTMAPEQGKSTSGNTSIAKIADNTLLVVGDRGFVETELAGIWGRTVKVERNVTGDTSINEAILWSDCTKLKLGEQTNIEIIGIFDKDGNLIESESCEIAYYSENPEIATVDIESGEVTAIAEGSARFTAAVSYNGKTIMTNSVDIIVADADKLHDFKVEIDKWSLAVGENEQITTIPLNYFDEPVTDVAWNFTSSNNNIASVSQEGLVTANSPGIAVITVTGTKGSVSLTKNITIYVMSGLWRIEDFEDYNTIADLPAKNPPDNPTEGFIVSQAGCSISSEKAFSGSKSLYIKDDIIDSAINVQALFPSSRAAIIEFMIYPEQADRLITVGVGKESTNVADEGAFIGFPRPSPGSNTSTLNVHSNGGWTGIRNLYTITLGSWNKVRLEVSIDSPGKLYINDSFITDIPIANNVDVLNRIRFSTAGTAPIGDYYYIDDLKVMLLDQTHASDTQLSDIKINGETIDGFSSDTYFYNLTFDEIIELSDIEATAAVPEAEVNVEFINPELILIKVTKDGYVSQYELSISYNKYTITVNSGTSDKETAIKGEIVSITADEAPEGMIFDKWVTFNDVEFDDINSPNTTFVMPGEDVTVTATYKASDEEAVAEDKAALTEELIKGNNSDLNNVTGDLNLVTSIPGGAGCTISWTSSNEAVIAPDGKVTRPEEGNAVVTLTATITKGSVSDTKEFNITVKHIEKDYILHIGPESTGGAGYTRIINISGTKADDLTGKYLVVQFTEGTGVNANVTVIMMSVLSEEATVSYQAAGTKVEAWLASGMPDLVGENMGVTVYAYVSTN